MDKLLFKEDNTVHTAVKKDITETGQDFKEWVPPTAGIAEQLIVKKKNPEQEDVVDVLAQHAAGFVLPAYITSEADRKLYHASVKEGKEQYRHIRVLFIGHESVGKTTLCGFLTTGKVPDLGHRESTYGADIFLHRMEIDWTTKKWINLDVPEADIVANRLGNVCASTEELQKTKVEVDKDTLKVEEVQPITTKEKPTSFINTPPETFTTMEEILTYTPNKIPEGNSQEQTFENKEQKIKYDPFEGQVLQAKKKGKKEIANVSFWDFAGQDDFYSSHHIFLSPDGVYVIVCNAKRCLEGMDEEKESECDKLVYWLRSVKTYSTSSEEEEDSPPIIVAGTHADQLQNLRDGQRRLVEFVSDLLERREIHGITVEWCILVDYTNGEETLNKLRGNIEEAAPRQDQWEKDIPAKWLALEHSILEEKTKNRKVLKWDEVKVLNKDIKAPIEKDEELKLFLRYLHESRHVIYFGEDGILSEEVIIDPKWLVDAFRCIITSEQFIGTEKLKLRKLLKDLQKSGKLKDNLIECAWQQDFIGNKELLLSVMERFGLIALPVEFRENIGRKDTFYIIPSFLKTLDKHPDEICQTNKDLAKQGCSLYLNFEQKFVPNEIYDRLIASCIANRKPTFDFDKCVFRHFGFFSVDKVLYFAVHCHHSFITLTLYRSNQKRDSAADEVRKWIEDRLQEILKLNRQECLKYTYSFHQNVLVNPDYLISLEEIKRHDEVPCRTKDKVYKSIESSDAEFWGILPKVLPEGNTEEIEKKKIHSQMLQKLHESLYLDCSQWTAFRNMLKPYITENELSKVIDIFGVAENLMQAGWIYYGKYDTLSEIFSTIGMKELQKVVQTYTEKF